MDCIFCNKYDIINLPQDKRLENNKLSNAKLTRMQLPNFEHDKMSYTKCDYMLERKVHEHMLTLEELFKEYQKYNEQELKTQTELLNNMWVYSQRYLILTGGVCVKPYPEIISLSAEKREVERFNTNLKLIKRSNCILAQSMEKIRKSYCDLNDLYKQLDMTVNSPFINGSISQKSVFCIRNILKDLLDYFNGNLYEMISLTKFLHFKDSMSIKNYLNLISAL